MNPSKQVSGTFANFHNGNDYRNKSLNEYVKENENLIGSYMTDLFEKVQRNSNELKKENSKKSKVRLFEQLNISGGNSFHIICFGTKVFKQINKLFPYNGKPNTLGSDGIKIYIQNFLVKKRN